VASKRSEKQYDTPKPVEEDVKVRVTKPSGAEENTPDTKILVRDTHEQHETYDVEQVNQEMSQNLNKAMDDTLDRIRKAVDDNTSQFPHYEPTHSTTGLKENTIQSTREIASNFLGPQKELVNSFQSVWTTYMDEWNKIFQTYYLRTEQALDVYLRMCNIFGGCVFAATTIANSMMFTNFESYKVIFQHANELTTESARKALNIAKHSKKREVNS
jgi:hypothetical protein